MSAPGDIVVVTSCTSRKQQGGRLIAESLYMGQQHVRLMRGVAAYRAAARPAGALWLRILSARHGLVRADHAIADYDDTFQGLSREAVRRRGRELGVPDAARRLLGRRFKLGMLLLGDDYLEACGLDESVELGGPTLCFCAPSVARRLPDIAGLHPIALTNSDARRFSCGLAALKGELGGRLLTGIAEAPGAVAKLGGPGADVLGWLERRRPTAALPDLAEAA